MANHSSADSLLGQRIDEYLVQDVLGRGGMGIVYKAEDESLSRTVALKVIDPALARDEAFVRRFRSEARALARIDSRYIVRIHTMRQTDAALYIVMEYVDGGTLSDLIQHGPVSWSKAQRYVEQMLTALEHAHSVGIVHRDIKPSNIMLSSSGAVKVTDFGLAKVHQADKTATVTKGIAGTLLYMSPEQVRGLADLDHRSDLYSMGMTIYQMLAGEVPIDRDAGEFSTMRSIVEDEFPSPRKFRPDIPPHVSEAVMKSLEKEPNRRFQSAAEMRSAFLSASGGPAYVDVNAKTIADVGPYVPEKKKSSLPLGLSQRTLMWGGAGVLAVSLVAAVIYLILSLAGAGTDPVPVDPVGATSLLTVSTVPDSVRVYAGSTLLGLTPLRNQPVQVLDESLTLSFQKEGYVRQDTTLTVEAEAPVTVQGVRLEALPPDAVTVQITSSPSDATVRINGSLVGPTPIRDLALPAGQVVTVEVRKSGCTTWTQRYEQVPATIHAPLSCSSGPSNGGGNPPPPTPTGTLTLNVAPQGTVRVQGESCQAGKACTVTAGSKRVTFEHPSYGSQTRTVSLKGGETENLTFYFEQPVAIQVRKAEDPEAPIFGSILIDGVSVAQLTDVQRQLGPGTHRIEVSRKDYVVETPAKNITIEAGFEQKAPQVLTFLIRKQ